MISFVAYFPVPTMSRDENVLPAMMSASLSMSYRVRVTGVSPPGQDWFRLAAADEIYDFDLVARLHNGRIEAVAFHDSEIVFDGHAAGVDVERRQQIFDGQRLGELVRVAVQGDSQRYRPGSSCDRSLSGAYRVGNLEVKCKRLLKQELRGLRGSSTAQIDLQRAPPIR